MSSINPSLVDSINSDVVAQNDILSIITSEGSSNEETDVDDGLTMNNIDSSSSDESTILNMNRHQIQQTYLILIMEIQLLNRFQFQQIYLIMLKK